MLHNTLFCSIPQCPSQCRSVHNALDNAVTICCFAPFHNGLDQCCIISLLAPFLSVLGQCPMVPSLHSVRTLVSRSVNIVRSDGHPDTSVSVVPCICCVFVLFCCVVLLVCFTPPLVSLQIPIGLQFDF